MTRHALRVGLAGAALVVLALPACGSRESTDETPAAGTERPSFTFTGTVERVDSAARLVTVQNDDVPGWMGAMSMSYSVDPPEVLERLAAGARVRATVYAGDFATLYSLEVVP